MSFKVVREALELALRRTQEWNRKCARMITRHADKPDVIVGYADAIVLLHNDAQRYQDGVRLLNKAHGYIAGQRRQIEQLKTQVEQLQRVRMHWRVLAARAVLNELTVDELLDVCFREVLQHVPEEAGLQRQLEACIPRLEALQTTGVEQRTRSIRLDTIATAETTHGDS